MSKTTMSKNEIEQKIRDLKTKLSCQESDIGDWKIAKCIEYSTLGMESPYDLQELHKQRQVIRDEIGALEEELAKCEDEDEAASEKQALFTKLLSKKAEGFSLRFVLINTGNISRKVLSKVLRSFDKNFERLQDGNVNGEYSDDMRLSPMIEILNNSDWTSQVEVWAETFEEQQIYEILYMGRRSFSSEEGLQYISGDADGDGTETGTGNFTQLRSGGEIVGFEVSLHIPDLNSVTPVRYIMEPEYVSQQELKQENTMQQVEDAKDTESWTVDQSDGTMYFFLDENNGWRLVITDAAAGSRFYVMEKTMDGGSTWECINDDPFSGQLGVAEGLIFYDENFGVAGITGASQSYSRLYVTRDGGRTFEEMKLPMDLVSELPQIAIDCGFTVEDFDYLNMPEKEDDTLTITVTTDAAEKDGIVFQSTDYGATWEYKGLVQIAN